MLVLIDDGQQFDRVMLLFEVGWMSVVEFLNALGKVVGIEFDDSVEVAYCQHSYILLVVKLSLQNSNIPILTSSETQSISYIFYQGINNHPRIHPQTHAQDAKLRTSSPPSLLSDPKNS